MFKKTLRKIVPRSVIWLLKKKPVTIPREDLEQVLMLEDNKYRSLLQTVSLRRSVYDDMYTGGGVHYLQVGLSALKCIKTAMIDFRITDVRHVLDMACGHGRVLRFMAKSFPGARITACDTDLNGVDFCRKELGAEPFYSKISIKKLKLKKKYDLIWCGSLATHFDREGISDLLSFFYQHLCPGGLLVFSMHGSIATKYLSSGEYNYCLTNEGVKKVLSEVESSGCGYADYPKLKGYGISVVKPTLMEKILSNVGKWKDYKFYEGAWADHHDIYSVVKE